MSFLTKVASPTKLEYVFQWVDLIDKNLVFIQREFHHVQEADAPLGNFKGGVADVNATIYIDFLGILPVPLYGI